MDYRPPPGSQRPLPPQRAVSGSYALQQGLRRAPLSSRLQNVRSVSQPGQLVDLMGDGARAGVRNAAAFLGNQGTVSSPGALYEGDGDAGRPAKRAKIEGRALPETEAWSGDVKDDIAHLVVPGSPLPPIPRPMRSGPKASSSKGHHRAPIDRAACRANGLEAPSIATRLPAPKYAADFAPWNGHHPEDILSETVVKAGYFDKPPGPNSTESNSAKPTIWPNLSQKNNMGLQTLSYLFTQVMEKRQVMGKCTAPSTFKPPPRVTVTDTKREAWLRDLANPEVPLRKQSRTIPHGIRGKLLMEQCMGKDIPMPRAVWLAKCVGANELRAFRRKGVSGAIAASGESKWVREWTVHVEQFLEGVVASCGQPRWQAKMNYAVKLATSFYTERLLERDHYLDWIVSSFAQAAPEALPVWTIMVQLYWQDVVAFTRRGRKLAQATLEIIHQSTLGSMAIGDVLKARLQKLIMVMAVANRGCLIIPKTWEKYSYLLVPSTFGSELSTSETHAQNVKRRNTRLTRPLRKTSENTRSAILNLYATVDTASIPVDFESLTTSCLASVPDVSKLVPALLNWSASYYRTGASRIYLAAGVLSQLSWRGYDTYEYIMGFLRTENSAPTLFENVYRVIAELIRDNTFSAGRYLQWLMTSGSLSRTDGLSLSNGLLTALPLDALQPHLLNSRNMLRRRLGLVEDETASVGAYVASIETAEADGVEYAFDVSAASESAKSAIARQISVKAAVKAKEGTICLPYFCRIRVALELCGDHRALADVVQFASRTEDTALLGTVTDTVSMHAQPFGALGCLQSLVRQLLERYNTLRSQQPLDRKFIIALTSLIRCFPDKQHLLAQLEQDLVFCEQQNSMNVCSPASDSIVSMQASNLASDSDIDTVFASGNNMDEQLMQRVFSRVVQRARKTMLPDAQFPSKICGWLDQLRAVAVDPCNFDQMAMDHVRACLKDPQQIASPCNVITALIASGCTSFASMADEAKSSTAAAVMVRILTSKATVHRGLHAAEAYQYQIQQQLYMSSNVTEMIRLVITAMEHPDLPLDDQGLVDLVLDYTVTHEKGIMDALASHSWSTAFLTNCSRLATKIMNLGRHPQTSSSLDALSIVANADALSIAFCMGALKLQAKVAPERSDQVQQAVMEAITNGSDVWPQLLASVSQNTVQDIYTWARDQVMEKAVDYDNKDVSDRSDMIRSLDLLDVTIHAVQQGDHGHVVPMITEKLKGLEAHISTMDMLNGGGESNDRLLRSLHVLLHLSILYSSTAGTGSDALNQSYCQLLASLCTFLVHPKLQGQRELLEYVYDVASALADKLPEENLAGLARSMTSKDGILSSLLGTCSSPDAWLAIVSHPQPQGTQQQRALMKQAGSQQQVPGRQPQQLSPVQQHGFQRPQARPEGRVGADAKVVPFPLRRWEIMSDATPMIGDNDTSLSLGLFGARKA